MDNNAKLRIDDATSRLMDVLRGLSALVVAYVHGFQIFLLPYFGSGSTSHVSTSLIATYAVNVFFVVSGFMICISVLRHHSGDGTFRSAEFAAARVLRIYPPLLLAIAVTLLVYILISAVGLHGSETFRLGGEKFLARERIEFEWSALPATLLLLYGAVPSVPLPFNMDGPLWTLSYEWWFYVGTFLLADLRSNPSFSRTLPTMLVAGMLIYGHNTLFLWLLLIWLGGFFLGLSYVSGWLNSTRYFPVAAALASICMILLFAIDGPDFRNDLLLPFDSQSGQKTMVVISLLGTLALSTAVRYVSSHHYKLPLGLARPASFSYTLYVIHYPLFLLGFSLLHPFLHGHGWMLSLAAMTAVLFAIAYMSRGAAQIVENRKLLGNLAARLVPRKIVGLS